MCFNENIKKLIGQAILKCCTLQHIWGFIFIYIRLQYLKILPILKKNITYESFRRKFSLYACITHQKDFIEMHDFYQNALRLVY